MTVWEFAACVEGFNRANNPKQDAPDMTPEEYDALCELGDMWSAQSA